MEAHHKLKESTIERKVCDYAANNGWLVYKFVSPGQKFVPDRIFLGDGGRTFFIEFKAPGKKPNGGQLLMHEKMRARGHTVYVIDNIGKGFDAVDKETL